MARGGLRLDRGTKNAPGVYDLVQQLTDYYYLYQTWAAVLLVEAIIQGLRRFLEALPLLPAMIATARSARWAGDAAELA